MTSPTPLVSKKTSGSQTDHDSNTTPQKNAKGIKFKSAQKTDQVSRNAFSRRSKPLEKKRKNVSEEDDAPITSVSRESVPAATDKSHSPIVHPPEPKRRKIMEEDTIIELTPKPDTRTQSNNKTSSEEAFILIDDEEENDMEINKDSLQIKGEFKANLSRSIVKEYHNLIEVASKVKNRTLKNIVGTTDRKSVSDYMAYHIGWGKRIIEWYETGKAGKTMTMPGDGFSQWKYEDIAQMFYEKYAFDSGQNQFKEFHQVVTRILEIVEEAHTEKVLDVEGIWPWGQTKSAQKWSLRKWVQVNTVAPFKRAVTAIKKVVD